MAKKTNKPDLKNIFITFLRKRIDTDQIISVKLK